MNKAKIKKLVNEESFSIGKIALANLAKGIEEITKDTIRKAIRNARLSGRKTIKTEDID